jgi:enoyl-CoA hydratase/carnithine racemase
MAKLLILNVPTMCVWQGHSIAGGVFLGLCHDLVIMKDDPKLMVCLNELSFGKNVPFAYAQLTKRLTNGRTLRTLFLGTKLTPKRAHELDIVGNLYTSDDDVHAQIAKFAKEKSIIARKREGYKITK